MARSRHVGLPLPSVTFNPQQRENENQESDGQLRRPAKISFAQPGCINAERQGVDAKEANRTKVDISSEPRKGTLIELTFPTTRVLAE